MSARDDCFPAFNKYEVEQTPEEILKAQLASLSELNAELHAENERIRALNAELVAKLEEGIAVGQAASFAMQLMSAENERIRALNAELVAALHKSIYAMRAPLDDWKGECERAALGLANDAIAKAEAAK